MLSNVFTSDALRAFFKLSLIGGALAWVQVAGASGLRSPQGGADGGGGDAPEVSAISINELERVVDRLPLYLNFVLNFQELEALNQQKKNLGGSANLRSVQQKMFGSAKENVFEALSRAQFRLSDGCQDLFHQEKDATAFNTDASEICLNQKTLLKKITSANVMTELLSLAVHELSHRTGANEEEARAIHEVVRQTMPLGSREAFEAALLGMPNHNFIPGFRESVQLIGADESSDSIGICMNLGLLSKHEIGKLPSSGISAYRFRVIQYAFAAQKQLDNLVGYCRRMGLLEQRYNYFHQRKDQVVMMKDAVQYTSQLEPSVVLDARHGRAQFGEYLDHRVLVFNFGEFMKNFGQVLSAPDLVLELRTK